MVLNLLTHFSTLFSKLKDHQYFHASMDIWTFLTFQKFNLRLLKQIRSAFKFDRFVVTESIPQNRILRKYFSLDQLSFKFSVFY